MYIYVYMYIYIYIYIYNVCVLIRVNNNGTISCSLIPQAQAYQEHQTKIHTDINVVIFINNVSMK